MYGIRVGVCPHTTRVFHPQTCFGVGTKVVYLAVDAASARSAGTRQGQRSLTAGRAMETSLWRATPRPPPSAPSTITAPPTPPPMHAFMPPPVTPPPYWNASGPCGKLCRAKPCGEWFGFGGMHCHDFQALDCSCHGCCTLDPPAPPPPPPLLNSCFSPTRPYSDVRASQAGSVRKSHGLREPLRTGHRPSVIHVRLGSCFSVVFRFAHIARPYFLGEEV